MSQLKEGMWRRHRHLLLFGQQLPFTTEEAILILLVARFGYLTPKNVDFQFELPRTGEKTQIKQLHKRLVF